MTAYGYAQIIRWADTHETSIEVARIIWDMADDDRTPQDIWENPTDDEWHAACVALLEAGHTANEQFRWGESYIEPAQEDRPYT